MTCLAYALNSGRETWRREVTMAAMVYEKNNNIGELLILYLNSKSRQTLWGPPWQAGKTASLTRFSMDQHERLSLR
jgi:hypothetical protein